MADYLSAKFKSPERLTASGLFVFGGILGEWGRMSFPQHAGIFLGSAPSLLWPFLLHHCMAGRQK